MQVTLIKSVTFLVSHIPKVMAWTITIQVFLYNREAHGGNIKSKDCGNIQPPVVTDVFSLFGKSEKLCLTFMVVVMNKF